MRPTTTQDLVDQVRSQIDEDNVVGIRTLTDIIPALNRGQDHACEILAHHYPDPLIRKFEFPLLPNVEYYPIPEDAMGDRVNKMETLIPGFPADLKRVAYNQMSEYETLGVVPIPYGYCIVGRQVRIGPKPSGTYSARMWYVRQPQPLVLPWGRITRLDPANHYLVVDSLGDSEGGAPTTNIDDLTSYFNIIDAQTGEIKGTFQVRTITGNRIDIKTTPDPNRLVVWNNPVATDMSVSIGDNVTAPAIDDYICPVDGTCVPLLKNPFANFFIQFAVAAMRRKLGDATGLEENVLATFEKEVKSTWAGREHAQRVLKKSQYLSLPFRRYITGTR